MTRYAVALGSNLGNRIATLRSAVAAIRQLGTDLLVSPLYETAPIGGPDQAAYLNAVVVFESGLSPGSLLDRLHDIEDSHHRVRVERWGPRSLDLDIVVTDNGPIDQGPDLIVPHPRAAERLFVVKPLADIWPSAALIEGTELDQLAATLADQDLQLVSNSWVDQGAGRWLVIGQLFLFAAIATALIVSGNLPAAGAWSLKEGVGLMLGALGVVVMWRSAVALGPSLSILPAPVRDGRLVSHGPYRLVRHPTYSGVVMLFAGAALLMGSVPALALSLALSVYLAFKARYEESELRAAYPDYREYMERVPRRFIPFLV